MRKVEEIERQIQTLSLSELRDWLLARDWSQWDAQIQSDVSAGRLDDLAGEALAEHQPGKSRKL